MKKLTTFEANMGEKYIVAYYNNKGGAGLMNARDLAGALEHAKWLKKHLGIDKVYIAEIV